MTRRVVLVRHAMSAVDPSVDSRRWGITGDATDDCIRLASAIPATTADIRSSSERKAVDTARIVANLNGCDVQIDERFGEVRRPYTDDDYRAIATTYLREGNDDWEPRHAVVARFTAAVDDALRIDGGPIVVVNHGLALSLYLASVVVDLDVAGFWSSLTFPDAWVLDLGTGELGRAFDGGRPAPDQT